MFGLFSKHTAGLEERFRACQAKKDWPGMARACYELGVDAMKNGEAERAWLWLHRADSIYSAKDETYDAVGEKLIDDCSERIGTLESAPILHNRITAQVEEKAEELENIQVRLWGLLSMARLIPLLKRLAGLPGCELLGRLDWALDMMLQSVRTPPTQGGYQQLMDICNELYELSDSEAYHSAGEISVPGGAAFQLFDLNSMFGVLLELNSYLDSHLRLLAAASQGAELPSPECGLVSAPLLPDYYVRTGAGRLEDVPQIKAELERIWSDHAFLRSGPAWEQVVERVDTYRKLDILQA